MVLHEELKILVSAFVAIYLFYVFGAWFRTFLSLLIANSSGEIDVSCLEDSLIEVIIQSTPAYRDFIGVYGEYVA